MFLCGLARQIFLVIPVIVVIPVIPVIIISVIIVIIPVIPVIIISVIIILIVPVIVAAVGIALDDIAGGRINRKLILCTVVPDLDFIFQTAVVLVNVKIADV